MILHFQYGIQILQPIFDHEEKLEEVIQATGRW